MIIKKLEGSDIWSCLVPLTPEEKAKESEKYSELLDAAKSKISSSLATIKVVELSEDGEEEVGIIRLQEAILAASTSDLARFMKTGDIYSGDGDSTLHITF